MTFHLIVKSPFGGYAHGDRIEDAETVAKVEAGENAGHVVRVAATPPAPEPAAEAAEPVAPHEEV